MDWWLLIPPLALGLDALFGDPPDRPHPVKLLGAILHKLEKYSRGWARGIPGRLRLAGAASVLFLAGGSGAAVYFLGKLPGAGWFMALYFAYAGLALQSLCLEVDKARRSIAADGVEAGRAAVALLVSRDVSQAGEAELYRALAETLAENINDGVVAPFFWLCLGGPAGMWAYKAVSTMDSMWGYKSQPWRDLGWAAARLDDILAWVPARISALCLAWLPARGLPAGILDWRALGRQARRMESPNAGWPMAAAAWRFARRMGGPTCYQGEIKDKPLLGPDKAMAWDDEALRDLLDFCRKSALLACLTLWLAFSLAYRSVH